MRLSTLRFMANRFSEENPMLGGYGGRMSQNKKITVRPVFYSFSVGKSAVPAALL